MAPEKRQIENKSPPTHYSDYQDRHWSANCSVDNNADEHTNSNHRNLGWYQENFYDALRYLTLGWTRNKPLSYTDLNIVGKSRHKSADCHRRPPVHGAGTLMQTFTIINKAERCNAHCVIGHRTKFFEYNAVLPSKPILGIFEIVFQPISARLDSLANIQYDRNRQKLHMEFWTNDQRFVTVPKQRRRSIAISIYLHMTTMSIKLFNGSKSIAMSINLK